MPNLYEVLGVTSQSTQAEIKRAFHNQARIFHPDKVGGSHERMQLINQAYETLSNTEKRHQFDQIREFFDDATDTQDSEQMVYERLSASGVPYSQQFKDQHAHLTTVFLKKPLVRGLLRQHFNTCALDHQQLDTLQPLFETLIAELKQTPSAARCCQALSDGLSVMKASGHDAAIFLNVIQHITTYVKNVSSLSDNFINVLQSNPLRYLFKYVLQAYWQDDTTTIDKDQLTIFDGRANTQAFLEDLKKKLMVSSQSGHVSAGLKNLAHSVRLLLQFENSVQEKNKNAGNAKAYRELAYHILDWVPAFAGKMPTAMLTNILMQAGVYFQLASQAEEKPHVQMADEKLAQQLYITTFMVGHHATPDVELYHYLHGLKFIAQFQYADAQWPELVQAFQHRALVLADVFPFYEGLMANIDFLQQEHQLLNVMRQLLHRLVSRIEANQSDPPAPIILDHPQAVVLYRAYEACVKHWYEQPYQQGTEKKIRLNLMQTLLADHGWDFADIEETVAFAQSSLQRDHQAWLQSASMLDETDTDVTDTFSSVNGFEVDYKAGRLKLLATPCDKHTPDCFRTLHLADLSEMFKNNIDFAIFSLDPVDPDMDYHPFNTMRFAPTRLYQSRFLETLLSTDYLLKFFTVGQEVQGAYPFDMRPLNQLTQHVPQYLRNIIEDFQHAQHSESLHRFWIEAESLPVTFDDKKLATHGIQTAHVYDVNMVVKKHRMQRDADGNLVDTPEHHEGWFFYVLTTQLKRAFDQDHGTIQQPALLFLLQGSQVLFLESQQKSSFILEDYSEPLDDLRQCARDLQGKVIDGVRSSELMYRITREVARQTGKPHHFSPEYIFAQEFSAHYEEFALYFPEFKRLQELSRVVILVRLLNAVRQNNQTVLSHLNKELAGIQQWKNHKTFPEGSDDKNKYQQAYSEISESLNSDFSKWRQELDYHKLVSRKKSDYRDLREKIGSLSLSSYSDEVNTVCQQMHDDNVRQYGYAASSQIWSQIDAERSNIARTISSQKRSQVQDALSSVASSATINRFLDRHDIDTLAHEATNHELEATKKQIRKSLDASLSEVESALQGSSTVIKTIATRITNKQFSSYLDEKKKHIQAQVSGRNRLENEMAQLGLGLNEQEINLLGLCLWVPAAVNHRPAVASNGARFVYGGVNVQPQIHFTNEVITNPNQVRLSAQQLSAAVPGVGSSGGVGTAGGSGGAASPPPTSGGSSGGGSGKGPSNSRFVMLADRVSKAEARDMLRQSNHGLTKQQVSRCIKTLGTGQMDNVSVKHMNNGDVRVFAVRQGHTEGYQRMSFGFDQAGNRTGVVQTAFDSYGNLVHQRPGQAKNNLYDVKYSRRNDNKNSVK